MEDLGQLLFYMCAYERFVVSKAVALSYLKEDEIMSSITYYALDDERYHIAVTEIHEDNWQESNGRWESAYSGRAVGKLAEYENIGEPCELRKVTFCHKCRFSLPKSLGEGLISGLSGLACQRTNDFVDSNMYCGWGEPREEQKNEL